jgi:uncharacterized protein (TIGR00290 family)
MRVTEVAVMQKEAIVSWSGGKDSAMALYELQNNRQYNEFLVSGLLTTITKGYDRISGHGLRREVLDHQVECIGLGLHKAYISQQSSMGEYESVMEDAYVQLKGAGANAIAFGDVFLKGPKKVHTDALRRAQIGGLFPLWRRSTQQHAAKVFEAGLESIVICVDHTILDESFIGRPFDQEFVDHLPAMVDPCGENGEFHTFVVGGPMFRRQVQYALGEVVLRGSHFYCDVLYAA